MTEESLTQRIHDLGTVKDNQRCEVAAKFLCEARTHLRNGKTELADRKVRAAANVLAGVVNV